MPPSPPDAVPIVDLSLPAPQVETAVARACADWGFFHLVGHGLDAALIQGALDEARGLFAAPLAAKRALSRSRDNPWGYYDRELTKNRRDKKEIFDIGPDLTAARVEGDVFFGATPFPDWRSQLRPTAAAYAAACEAVCLRLLAPIATGLGAPAGALNRAFEGVHTGFLRLNHYPTEDLLAGAGRTVILRTMGRKYRSATIGPRGLAGQAGSRACVAPALTPVGRPALLGLVEGAVARRILLVLIWLGLACATHAQAGSFAGVNGAVIALKPPAGDCLLDRSDARYPALSASFGPNASIKAIFTVCGDRSFRPERAGFILGMPQNPRFPASDNWRSEWLLEVLPPHSTEMTDVSLDRRDGAALYYHTIAAPGPGTPYDTIVEATAVTIIKNTPLRIIAVRIVSADDLSATATALDEARTLRHDILARFGKANGVDFDHVVTSEQLRSAIALGAAAFVDVAGAILMLTLAVRRLWVRAGLAALLAVAGVLVYRAAPGAGTLTGRPLWDIGLWAAAAVLFAALASGFWLALNVIRLRGVGLADRMRTTLTPANWSAPTATAATNSGDFTKRWFVTVAAATGGVVVAMLGHESFVEELTSAFGPSRIVFTLLAAIVSITLIGPVEEFIFGAGAAGHKAGSAEREAGEASSRFEQLLGLMSPRALGRFALVLVFMLMLTVMHGAFEARVEHSQGEDITTMLVASVGPAIITYYWCAALQHGVSSVARRAGFAAALAGLLTIGIPNTLVHISDAVTLLVVPVPWMNGGQSAEAMRLFAITVPAQLVFSVLSFGAVGFAGGAVIDIALRRRLTPMATVALIGGVLFGLVLAREALLVLMRLGLTPLFGPDEMEAAKTIVLAVTGWLVGLVVSGFPTVLQSGAARAARDDS